MSNLAKRAEMLPLSESNEPIEYGLEETSWDGDEVRGCSCVSSWTVGLGANETQTPEYFGPNCALRHCPSGDDPVTSVDETDCTDINGGNAGNLCHVDCSNRGTCDYLTGLCTCRAGFSGEACTVVMY
jgi:hypothetical protein